MRKTADLNEMVEAIVTELRERTSVEIEASARHIHLDQRTVDELFGEGYKLTPRRPLSQPGQFVCDERLTVIGPKGVIENVAVLGPVRQQTQVELSLTDARTIGVNAPLRESGHLENTPGLTLDHQGQKSVIDGGAIVAQRHIHMTPEDAKLFGVRNGDVVSVQTSGERSVVFNQVVIRVSEKFATRMHVDFDEANACGLEKRARGIIKK